MARIHEIASLPPSRNRKAWASSQSDPPDQPGQSGQLGQSGQSGHPGPAPADTATVGVKSRLRTGALRRLSTEPANSPVASRRSPADDGITSEVEDILYDLT